MTNREFFTTILTADVPAELKEFATAAIAKLDTRNEKRANTPTKAQQANEPIKAEILAYLGEHSKALASELATACGVSTQKISALCKILAEDGKVTVTDVKVKGKGVLKAYSLTAVDEQ